MNGHFETSGTYPFSTSPAAGWGHPNPTGEYIISYIPIPGKAALLNEDKRGYALVETEFATRFPDVIEATRAAHALVTK